MVQIQFIFFFEICVFLHNFLEKNYLLCLIYAIFDFENFNHVFETVLKYVVFNFLIIFYFQFQLILQIDDSGSMIITMYFFSIFDF